MNLTEESKVVKWPETHYAFVERVGPFMENAGQAWQAAHALVEELKKHNEIMGYMSLYKRRELVYRAGFALGRQAVVLPEGLRYERFPGGAYRRFVLTGPYTQLPEASKMVWSMIEQEGIALRDDFAIENYLNSPQNTPAAELITEILIPVSE